MLATFFILAWLGLGCATAAVLPVPTESRSAWMPMAAFFGPLWVFVAVEMRIPEKEPSVSTDVVGGTRFRCTCASNRQP